MEDSLLDEVRRFYDSVRGVDDDKDEDQMKNRNRALVFPSVNSYLRFKVHQMVNQDQDFGGQLVTFSVGKDGTRRLVLAWKSKVKEGAIKDKDKEKETEAQDPVKQVQEEENSIKKEVSQEAEPASGRKTRRPDRQVYVPRQRRKHQERPENNVDKESSEEARPAVGRTFQSLEEEIAASLVDGVEVVYSDLVVPSAWQEHSSSSSSHHFLTRWLKPEDADGNSERIDPNLVLEVHDFDADLKTGDLARELSAYRGCFDLRWVDDTHALVVFKTTDMADRALRDKLGKIKLRRLEEGIEESQVRASKLAPPAAPAPRPQTSTLVARRMMGGALGVNLISDRREKMERDKLQKARSVKNDLRRTSREEDD